MSNNDDSDPDFTIRLPLPPPPTPSNPPSNAIIPINPNANLQVAYEQSPKRKRSKTTASSSRASSSNPSLKLKPKITKKPDPNAPTITRPCTECGKRFWSWKALFGHMRCHPEREWRGINPPPDRQPQNQHHNIPKRQRTTPNLSSMTEQDREIASCLILLANTIPTTPPPSSSTNVVERFECGVCKKVFASHQALGGHRASHKNVKGCFANDLNVASTSCSDHQDHGGGKMVVTTGSGNHKCNICSRVFSSGQALGGHMRCHWEKGEETPSGAALDLNLPAVQEDQPSTLDTPGCSLDLRKKL